MAEWGPIGNSILFIKENNIYFKPNVVHPAIQITDDGSANIYNGICDWVYEEEVFATKTAAWLSPNNKKLAYVQFDDTPVNHITIPVYGQPGSPSTQYPGIVDFPYPKSGTNNPLVKLFLVDLTNVSRNETVKKVQIPAPEKLRDQQHIVAVVSWANNETLLSTWMNRVQNHAIVESCKGQSCQQVLDLASETGWIDFFKAPTFNKNGSQFIYIAPQYQPKANDSYQHLTLVTIDGGIQSAITSGEFNVLEILHWNEESNTVFYAANQKNAPHVKHIYSTEVHNSTVGDRQQRCLTCNITRSTYFDADFSGNGKYIIVSNNGPSVPRTDLVMLTSHNSCNFIFFFLIVLIS